MSAGIGRKGRNKEEREHRDVLSVMSKCWMQKVLGKVGRGKASVSTNEFVMVDWQSASVQMQLPKFRRLQEHSVLNNFLCGMSVCVCVCVCAFGSEKCKKSRFRHCFAMLVEEDGEQKANKTKEKIAGKKCGIKVKSTKEDDDARQSVCVCVCERRRKTLSHSQSNGRRNGNKFEIELTSKWAANEAKSDLPVQKRTERNVKRRK